jgi:protein-S-isoprenylcysteine O-methyltransferase Ste14
VADAPSASRTLQGLAPIRLTNCTAPVRAAGGLLTLAGAGTSAAVVAAFRRAETPVSPLRPTARLVCAGPYRFSRNPDYLGQAISYTGVALLANTPWPLLLRPALASPFNSVLWPGRRRISSIVLAPSTSPTRKRFPAGCPWRIAKSA